MFLTVLLLLASAVAIYLACEWFVNAVEWLGARLNVGTVAVGTVLAAIGTALPESVVTFVAVVFGDSPERKEIGVGAAMGGPLALSTIAYATIGVVLAVTTKSLATRLPNRTDLISDQRWFLVIFLAKLGLGLIAFNWKPWLAIGFLAAYVVYAVRELRSAGADGGHSDDDLEPLKLQPRAGRPATWAIAVQTLGTLAVIFVASEVFVGQLERIGPALGLAPAVVALLLAPVATELPEVLNAVIWVRQGKTELAIGNVSGSMMIQATIPSALGIGFTPWLFDTTLIIAGAVTLLSIVVLVTLGRLRRLTSGTLLIAGGIYVAFLATAAVIN
ncbi:sodium:calcium antiporter [Nakamurella deserti]|uniref:sodium:calcium antiporter n=1 Tax=Nakamurella deserti TaxID=2164074 RepID=UPI00197C46DF|nr:sodium:calcium antiporter [Nakamurella deserti]